MLQRATKGDVFLGSKVTESNGSWEDKEVLSQVSAMDTRAINREKECLSLW